MWWCWAKHDAVSDHISEKSLQQHKSRNLNQKMRWKHNEDLSVFIEISPKIWESSQWLVRTRNWLCRHFSARQGGALYWNSSIIVALTRQLSMNWRVIAVSYCTLFYLTSCFHSIWCFEQFYLSLWNFIWNQFKCKSVVRISCANSSDCSLELQTKIHTKISNHGECAY